MIYHRRRIVMTSDYCVPWAAGASHTTSALINWLINAAKEIVLVFWSAIVFISRRSICWFLSPDFFLNYNFFISYILHNLVDHPTFLIALSSDSIHLCFWYSRSSHSLSGIYSKELLSLNFVEVISRKQLSVRYVDVVFLYKNKSTRRWRSSLPRTRYSLLTTDDWAAWEVNPLWRSTIYGCYKVSLRGR